MRAVTIGRPLPPRVGERTRQAGSPGATNRIVGAITRGRVHGRVEPSRPSVVEGLSGALDGLGAQGDADAVAALARRYRVGADAVTRIAAGAATALAAGDSPDAVLAEAEAHCRSAAREGLDQLARRVDVRARWTDLVLPEASVGTLREMVTHLRHREQVHERWGVADKSARGLGLVGLFSGPSGTGKTMAAEVIASELGLDLYVIDLSAVVSKYIGETEKNLSRVFDAAESCGAVLLFDEADALFGKRSEVKDSHDRYANIEVGYLLARIEAYRGLAVLTTNTKDALDPAFLRRFTFALEFKAPDAGERAALWARLWPEALPQAGLDLDALAAVPLTGGHIRNTIVRAAFLAAEDGAAVGMRHVRRALHSELTKLGRPAPKEWRR